MRCKRPLGGWRPVLVLVALIALESVIMLARHRSLEELEVVAAEGTTEERLEAFQVLLNRGERPRELYVVPFVNRLWNGETDWRMRHLIFTNDVCKFKPPQVQIKYILADAADFPPEWWISFVTQFRKVGGRAVGSATRLRRMEFEWFLDAVRGRALDKEAIEAYVQPQMYEISNEIQPR